MRVDFSRILNLQLKSSIIACLLLATTVAWGYIPNLVEVEQNILRGGRPVGSDFALLEQKGIRTIISLEIASTVAKERRDAEALGMRFISIPMSVYQAPTNQEMNQILHHLNDSSLYPLFIHCKHGEDRTGLVIGLYRVENSHWSPQRAYEEMLKLGFHPKYAPLDNYFKERTGLGTSLANNFNFLYENK